MNHSQRQQQREYYQRNKAELAQRNLQRIRAKRGMVKVLRELRAHFNIPKEDSSKSSASKKRHRTIPFSVVKQRVVVSF